MSKLFSVLILPLVLFLGAFVLNVSGMTITPGLPEAACYAAAGLAGVLCWRFKRSRGVFATGLILLGFWLVSFPLASGMQYDAVSLVGYAAYADLLPIFFCILVLMGDRGLLTPWGILFFSAVAFCGALFLTVVDGGWGLLTPQVAQDLQNLFATTLHHRLLPSWADMWTWLPQPAMVHTFLAVVFLLLRAFFLADPLEVGFLGALLCTAAGLHCVGNPSASGLFFFAAFVSLIVPLFQDSYRMAFLDELTEIPSRRAMTADFKKLGGCYALAMCDIDHFKKFNDTYGHDVGDDVLRMVATHLNRVSGGGSAYRYGGEEFAILFPNSNTTDAQPHLEQIRANIENSPFTLRANDRAGSGAKGRGKATPKPRETVSVTISIGVAERKDQRQQPEDVLKEADKALYKAKNSGRNQVAVGH